MCWNYQVSLVFSVVYIITNSYYWVKRPYYWREYLLFGSFYLVMEVFQTVQWLYGRVYENSLTGISNCDPVNTYFTVFANLLIWLQPVLYGYIGYRTSGRIKFFRYFLLVSWLVLVYSLFSLWQGYHYQDYYRIEDSIFGASTCTNIGSSNHLVWRFKYGSLDYAPNYLLYLILCSFAFLMYDTMDTKIIGIGWLVALLVTRIVLRPALIETASAWCLLSIVGNVIIITYLKFTN